MKALKTTQLMLCTQNISTVQVQLCKSTLALVSNKNISDVDKIEILSSTLSTIMICNTKTSKNIMKADVNQLTKEYSTLVEVLEYVDAMVDSLSKNPAKDEEDTTSTEEVCQCPKCRALRGETVDTSLPPDEVLDALMAAVVVMKEESQTRKTKEDKGQTK